MSECAHCDAVDDPENGIVVGLLGDINENVCTICRTQKLSEETVLTNQEAKVAAHKQLTGATHETIADRTGLKKSTVDEYSRRMKERIRKAGNTTNELSEFL